MNPFERSTSNHDARRPLASVQNETALLDAENSYQEARLVELLPLLRQEEKLKIHMQLQDEILKAVRNRGASLSEIQKLQEQLRVLRGGQPEAPATPPDSELADALAVFEAAREELDTLRLQISERDGELRKRFGLS